MNIYDGGCKHGYSKEQLAAHYCTECLLARINKAEKLLHGFVAEYRDRKVWNDKVCPKCESTKTVDPKSKLCLLHAAIAWQESLK